MFEDDFDEHNWVSEKYIELMEKDYLYNDVLTDTGKGNMFKNKYLELKITGEDSGKIKYLEVEDKDANMKIFYGTKNDNIFKCEDNDFKSCKFYGGEGSDEFQVDEKDIYIEDYDVKYDRIVLLVDMIYSMLRKNKKHN